MRRTQTANSGRRNSGGASYFALIFILAIAACGDRSSDLYHSARQLYKEGRFQDARLKAQEGYYSSKAKSGSEWHWKFALLSGELQLLSGNATGADEFLSVPPSDQFPRLQPRYQMLRGYSLYRRKHFAEAEGCLKKAIRDSQTVGDFETQTDAWLYLGTFHVTQGALTMADLDFRQAEQLAEANRLNYQRAGALSNRGGIQLKRGRFADAIPLLESARDLANREGVPPIAAFALTNLATCYENLGDFDQASTLLRTAVAAYTQFGLATSLSNTYSELGSIQAGRGETAEALRYFHQALKAVTNDAPVQYSLAAGNLAKLLEQTGSLDEAERFNRIALDFADQKNLSVIASLRLAEAKIAQHRDKSDQAIPLYQKVVEIGSAAPSVLWQAHAGLAGVYSSRGDFPKADTNYSKALAVITTNRADQLKADYKLTFLSSLMHFYQDYVALLLEHGDTERALEVADSSRASVLAEALLDKAKPGQASLVSQLQKAAKSTRTVFLFYWLAPKTSYVWAITGTHCEAVPLADQKQIKQDVESYRNLIEQEKRDPLASASPSGARLYRSLIAPIADFVPRGTRVVIVPDGVLHNLNFETLLVPSPQPHYWIEDATISVAPSLSILRAGKSTGSARRSLLLMGDPIVSGTGFAPLPQSALEISKITAQFTGADSKVLTGTNAVVDAYAAAKPQNYSTIHFATHADANSQNPLSSAIILSPNANGFRLYARDIAQTPLSADLVTISACRGAGARTLSGEGLVGFAWAFFQARAQNVVTSLWDVYDNSSAQLMGDFYSGVSSGAAYPAALREAKLKMLQTDFKKPYYWAPFQLYSRTISAWR